MIDFHTHILPAVDDGAANRDEALALIEALRREGIKTAVCTPHFDPSRISLQDFAAQRSKAFLELGDACIRLVAASETFLHDYLFHYSDLSLLCIEHTQYLLLELPFFRKWDDRLYSMLNSLISDYNIIPIIAHIERYAAARKKAAAGRLKEAGCLLQLNTSSLLDAVSQKRAIKLIKKGYIDLLGSDCHDRYKRPPVIIQALQLINEHLGEKYIRQLEENGMNVLNNIDIRS